jgi:LysM repeat protein
MPATIQRGATGSWSGEITAGDGVVTYEVQPGDSLSIIARDILGDVSRWPEIAALNNIPDPYVIRVGQLLRLPKSRPVPVQLPAGTPDTVMTATSAPPVQVRSGPNWTRYLGWGAVAMGLYFLFS